MKNFNKIISQEMLQKAKENFYKSDAPTSWKNKLKPLKVIIQLNPRLSETAGKMFFEDYYPGISLDNLTQFNGKLGKWIIELNPKVILTDSPKQIFDLISHELAHTLDFLVNEDSQRHFHNATWKYIHKCMGGTGEQFYNNFKCFYKFRQLKPLLKDFQNA
jgi:hypothetical protein